MPKFDLDIQNEASEPNLITTSRKSEVAVFVEKRTSRERPKSAPYLRLKKTRKRKPLFLQLETTKALKNLETEKKFRFFFEISLKFPVSRIVPKNVKRGTLWDFLNIHSVVKYQKLMGGTIKKVSEKIGLSAEKRRKVSVSKKVDPSALEWLLNSC